MSSKRLYRTFGLMAMLLLIPLIAMQFTTEVQWELLDFVVAGGLLFSTSLAVEFVFQNIDQASTRITLYTAFLLMFLLVWAELAVGVFD